MPISNTNIISPLYIGNGTTTEFPTGFFTAEADEIKVITRAADSDTETVLTLGTDYTVTHLAGKSGSFVVLADPLPENTLLRVLIDVPITQELGKDSGLEDGEKIPVLDFVSAFDKLTQVYQMLESEINLFGSRPTDTINIEGLPQGGAEQAGYVLGYSSPDGNEIVGIDPNGLFPPVEMSPFGSSLISTSDASSARGLLGLGTLATQNGTFSGTSSGTNTGDQNVFSQINVPGNPPLIFAGSEDITLTGSGGTVLSLNDSTITITPPEGGQIKHVEQNYRRSHTTITTSTTPQLLPGFQTTFTPTSSNSRVLIMGNMFYGTSLGSGSVRFLLYKNGSPIGDLVGDAAGSRRQDFVTGCGSLSSANNGQVIRVPFFAIDTVGGSGTVNYAIYIAEGSGAGNSIYSPGNYGTGSDNPSRGISINSFFVMEL